MKEWTEWMDMCKYPEAYEIDAKRSNYDQQQNLCPVVDCDWRDNCYLVNSERKHEFAMKTLFNCKDCGKPAHFYCGDVVFKLCQDCKANRLE